MTTAPIALQRSAPAYPMGPGPEAMMWNMLWAGLVQAAQAQMQMQGLAGMQAPMARDFQRFVPGAGGAPFAPAQSTGRTMPQVVGSPSGAMPGGPFRHSGACGNGNFDVASMLAQRLFAHCPAPAGSSAASSSAASSSAPSSSSAVSDGSSTSETEPSPGVAPTTDGSSLSDGSSESTGEKVFILGDLRGFGGKTVRNGLKELLRSMDNPDRRGERTHSKMSEEDAAKVRAMLESDDPEVRRTLARKVPDRKSLVISEDGKRVVDTISTKDKVTNNASLDVQEHVRFMNVKGMGRNFDRSAGGQITLGDKTYDVAATELHSPIKIALDGKDAKLNSTNGFAIDLNGFNEAGGKATTSGGLNANEAWLVRDKDGDGVKRNGVVDGNDVYGDHNGKYTDGYHQLARDFADEIKVGPDGKRYIDLTDPNSRAGRELQLLDASGNLRPARDVLNRIGVDELDKAKDEADGKGNVITARGAVTYKDGHTATSADQWYTTRRAG